MIVEHKKTFTRGFVEKSNITPELRIKTMSTRQSSMQKQINRDHQAFVHQQTNNINTQNLHSMHLNLMEQLK